jgi:hypothetical protein
LWLVLQRVTQIGRATVSESVSELGQRTTTLPQFAGAYARNAQVTLPPLEDYEKNMSAATAFHATPICFWRIFNRSRCSIPNNWIVTHSSRGK